MQYLSEMPIDIRETLVKLLNEESLNFHLEWFEDGSVVFSTADSCGAYKVTVEKKRQDLEGRARRQRSLTHGKRGQIVVIPVHLVQ
ncbi:Uncharacterised protein [Leminorella grimontii]|uniref:hypothetical protein n=1 Tax=Leminorella grimontii TaxID=82981 RepID=UPI00106A8F83|nr:hypothetical protein [Leminorella grimontii]VFS56313.1 Uncharacterised protein [Leminorella grimontii]